MREEKEIKAIQGRLIDGTGSIPTKQAIVVIEEEKIKKKLVETQELDAEASRRYSVANIGRRG